MNKAFDQEIDTQFIAENVGFLDGCFDVSLTLQNTLDVVKDFAAEELDNACNSQSYSKRSLYKKQDSVVKEKSILDNSRGLITTILDNNVMHRKLSDWGLPDEIVLKYDNRGVKEMFDWQVQCLGNTKVLMDCSNLVYSAPTSAGKTLVAEILMIKTVLERQKKVIVILPFVSIVREKMFYLQDILSSSGLRVEGFMGSQAPPGGLQTVHVAICTIEKANSLVNRLLDEGDISDLGAVIVDEMHLLGDPHRGYILELLLTKIKYVSSKCEGVNIQIIGMSATLPNLEILSKWLDAELFITQFRPIPLEEYCLVSNQLYNKRGEPTNKIDTTVTQSDNVFQICFDTIKEGCSILIFCMTKNWCENLAQGIASTFYKLGSSNNELGLTLRKQLKPDGIMEVLEQLKSCPVGLDQVLKKTVSFGVAYHHAGLTFDERDIIEGGFKSGAIRVLVATSTLSSGVNLPARKVIIRSPVFQRQPINILTYKQMAGRAGRMGRDTMGESIIICTEAEKKIAFDLMMGTLDPVMSCIDREDKYMRAILEVIASQVASTKSDLEFYAKCTLQFYQNNNAEGKTLLLNNSLDELKKFELIRIQNDADENEKYVATSLGKACLSSSMSPNDGLSLFCELQKARQCIVLETDLHLIYLVTPYSVSSQWGNIDWLHLLTLWESLTKAMKRVGELVGVQESFIIRCVRSANKLNNLESKMNVHKRFYTALALQDLVNEVSLSDVANKFRCPRGFLQSLQQAGATFAGMVTAFCHQLGWKNMEMLFSQFQDRLHFGIHSELLELMRLPSLNGMRARSLFNSGFESVSSIALADVNKLENSLHLAVPFQSEKEREGDSEDDLKKRNKLKNIWVTGYCGLTTRQAAENLIIEARQYLEREIGVDGIKWKNEILNGGKIKAESIHITNDTTLHIKPDNESNDEISSLSIPEIERKTADDSITETCSKINVAHNIICNTSATDINKELVTLHLKNVDIPPVENILDDKGQDRSRLELDGNKTIELIKINVDTNIWDTAVFSEEVFNNISKARVSDQVWSSKDVSFENLDEATNMCKNIECSRNVLNGNHNNKKQCKTIVGNALFSPNVTIFSSDNSDSSSLFEDSLPLDLVPSKLFDNNNSFTNTLKNKEISEKSTSQSISSQISNEDNLKLFYESDSEEEQDVIDQSMNSSKSDEIQSSQETVDFSRSIKKSKCNIRIINTTPNIKCNNSKTFTIHIDNTDVKCYHLKDEAVIEFISSLNRLHTVSLCFSVETKQTTNVIGSKLMKKKDSDYNSKHEINAGIALYCDQGHCVYLDLNLSEENKNILMRKLSKLFRKTKLIFKVLGTQLAFIHFKKYLSLELPKCIVDISLSEWLIDSDENEHDLIFFIRKHMDFDVSTIFTVDNRRNKRHYRNFSRIELACTAAWAILHINYKQSEILSSRYPNVEPILDIEVQVSKILAECGFNGIAVDKKLSAQFLIDVKNAQGTLQNMAYKLCGYHFNFNSSKEVAKILGIYNGRKVSTKKSVLSSHQSPISRIIIFWRKLNAILTKTLYPLTANAANNGDVNRIYPRYTMFTCSGRISMHEPNLQSVPRTFSIPASFLTPDLKEQTNDVIEFNCRNIFKASIGCVLVSADYSQLELRILTHYCKDTILTNIMRSDMDVFKSIASSWGSIPEDEVDDDLRQKAKQLCYGIIYGMGNRTLSQVLDVSEIEASVFMDTFHKTYPAIKVFTQRIIEDCRKKGYIETLMKRRRYLPDINSKIVGKKSSAERQAVNTTIQGSAADIAKAAMVAIDNQIQSYTEVNKPRLILQLHDELIYEVPQSNQSTFVKTLKSAMENTIVLNVPLPVKVKAGYTWGSLDTVQI